MAVSPLSLAAAVPAAGSAEHSAVSFSITFLVRLTAMSRTCTWLLGIQMRGGIRESVLNEAQAQAKAQASNPLDKELVEAGSNVHRRF